MKPPLSRYTPEVLAAMLSSKAKAAYVFIIDGNRGTGGTWHLQPQPTVAENRALGRELAAFMRRSADLIEQDMGPEPAPEKEPA